MPYGLATALVLGAGLLFAGAAPGWSAPAFDPPTAVKELPPKSDAEPDEVRCTSFGDLTVRELLDGPTSKPPQILPAGAACTTAAVPGAIPVALDNMFFEGRKGPFLFFGAMDAQGAADFVVINAKTGAAVFKDAVYGDGAARKVMLENGALKLSYLRGVNAPCSLFQSAARCWASLVMNEQVPKDMAQQIPDAKICAAAYKKTKAPKDNPSILTYASEVLVSPDGTLKELSRGKVGCESMP
ncbi:hypothetical protein ABLE93_04225 [Xanthobacter sp. KR7-65]|uniref:hypothetical protein n=1 Tax=Xanthobacter sp. KR7-65 TaxID=3156612 RepID=UPI0032B54C6C